MAFRVLHVSLWLLASGAFIGALSLAAILETRSAFLQSTLLSRWAASMTFVPAAGANTTSVNAGDGPYDKRLGYAQLRSFTDALMRSGYGIERQAVLSASLDWVVGHGFYAPYHEKDQTGLTLYDRTGTLLHRGRYPAAIYHDFDEVPPLVVTTLLFIEDRHLLDAHDVHRNPAVEWRRLVLAAGHRLGRMIDRHVHRGGGASTLATQIEKFRHSPQGRTDTIEEKLRQMVSAALRTYRDGPDTLQARKQIVVTYLNATPLASRPGFGEIIGIGDALSAWFGTDLAEANRVLSDPAATPSALARKGQIYREVLGLLLAERRPAYYLQTDLGALAALTNRYLDWLATANVIDVRLRDAARAARFHVTPEPAATSSACCVVEKGTDALRAELLRTLNVASLYDLDRLDLTGVSTIDLPAQSRVSDILAQLNDPAFVESNHLVGEHLLHTTRNLKLKYSAVIYERGTGQDVVRVHADSSDEPFDINAGAKLILGSTAKLRTLVTYLNIMTALHDRYTGQPKAELSAAASRQDPLTAWAMTWLALAPDRGLQPMLDAAIQRRYSAAPGAFFTNGGMHPFHNFETWEDTTRPTVEEAFENSINLAFVRLMRDVREYFIAQNQDAARIMADRSDKVRQAYLRRFAEEEGRKFVSRFYHQYRGLNPAAIWALILRHGRTGIGQRITLFRSVRPLASLADLRMFLAAHAPSLHPDDEELQEHYDRYGPDRFSLADRAYIAGVHPLEIAVASYLLDQPRATGSEVQEQLAAQRQEAYAWLFKTHGRHKQDVRLRILLEEDAFDHILEDWHRQGYPFSHLVPSLSTAIGSSGDRPDALAELIGIVRNGGVRKTIMDFSHFAFAVGTPYETTLHAGSTAPERIMAPEVAETIRRALIGVVKSGTAKGLQGAYLDAEGRDMEVGGKTGTGDNRFDTFARGGGLISARPVDRTATFVFFVGDRFYGTITAYIAGREAGQYSFTSALAVQVLRVLEPALRPLFRLPETQEARSTGLRVGAADRGTP
ncbi:MAG TPA: transglycosylase domain-containing protein [Rhodopila sp.]|nr:transglycosylase domain-containing protein [Rhodopila sp.]